MANSHSEREGQAQRLLRQIMVTADRIRHSDSKWLRKLRRWFSPVLNLTLLVLWLLILYRNRDDLPLVEQMLQPQVIGLCILAYVISYGLQLGVWASLMGYGWNERRGAINDYVCTTFMDRVPGGIWKIVGRMTIYRAPHLTPRTILAINILEPVLLLVANASILLVVSALSPTLRMVASLAFVGVLTLIVTTAPRFISTLRGRGLALRWLFWLSSYVGCWLCGGLLVYTLFWPLIQSNFTWSTALHLWCLSGAVAVVLQLLPLSSLFRDVTLVALIKPFLPLHRVLIAVLALRLIVLTSELLIGWSLLGALRLLKPVSRAAVPVTLPPSGGVWEDTTE